MATTYAGLQDELLAFLNEYEAEGYVANFIALAEADMDRDIRHWQMEARSTATFNAQYISLPTDWLDTIRVILPGKEELHLVGRSNISEWRARQENATGQPRYYCHTAGQIELWPTPDGSYSGELVYYRRTAKLSDNNTSNWLLDTNPDAYLYGSLVHAGSFLGDARTPNWQGAFERAVARINAESKRATSSGSRLSRR